LEKIEIRDLFVSTIVLGLIFSLSSFSITKLIISIFIVGIAFIFHEIAHRETAKKFGAKAVYKIWPSGLLIALVLGFVSQGRLIFASPGAVYMSAKIRWKDEFTSLKNEEYGVIALSGPLANLGLSIVFLALNAIYQSEILVMGASVNIILGFFNMLPLPPFDGSKVMRWDRKVWVIIFSAAFAGWLGIWLI